MVKVTIKCERQNKCSNHWEKLLIILRRSRNASQEK